MPYILGDHQKPVQPIIRSQFGDVMSILHSHQGQKCAFFEAQFYRCMEAFGTKLARKYCDLEQRDYDECVHGEKQQRRAWAIQKERMKQYAAGKRSEPFEKNWPPLGDYQPDHFSSNRIF